MEKELEYLKMYLDYFAIQTRNIFKKMTINYKNSCDDYRLLENMEIPIVSTYDVISIQEGNIIVSHMGTRADNLKVTSEKSCQYCPTEIETNAPETFSLESFKNSDYFNVMLNRIHISYENALEKGKELYEKYQDSLQPSTHHSTYKLTKTFETSNGEYVEMNVYFMENTIEIDSTHGEVDFDSITIVDKEEYERLKESSKILDALLVALDRGTTIQKIKNEMYDEDGYYIGNGIRDGDINILKELVDKETPMKPMLGEIWKDDYKTIYDECGFIIEVICVCPNCEKYSIYDSEYSRKFKRCHDCGQSIDWSNENVD